MGEWLNRLTESLLSILGYVLAFLIGAALLSGARWADAKPNVGGIDKPGVGGIEVYDGDTFTFAGERIRIANIDTPELFSPHCDAEKRLARLAKLKLKLLLSDVGGIDIIRMPEPDRFGRTLARVRVNGIDVGESLIADGLAAPWTGRRFQWCCGG